MNLEKLYDVFYTKSWLRHYDYRLISFSELLSEIDEDSYDFSIDRSSIFFGDKRIQSKVIIRSLGKSYSMKIDSILDYGIENEVKSLMKRIIREVKIEKVLKYD